MTPGGATDALFQLTNGLGRDIGFAAGPIEMKAAERWARRFVTVRRVRPASGPQKVHFFTPTFLSASVCKSPL